MFLRSVLLWGLHALALAGPLTKPSTDSNVTLERGPCPDFWYTYETDCYRYVTSKLTWAQAELYCQSLDAHLVSIHTPEEVHFISKLLFNFDPTTGFHWMGLSDGREEGTWLWSDGSDNNFDSWYRGQPDNLGGAEHCARMKYQGWIDDACTLVASSVCKRKPYNMV